MKFSLYVNRKLEDIAFNGTAINLHFLWVVSISFPLLCMCNIKHLWQQGVLNTYEPVFKDLKPVTCFNSCVFNFPMHFLSSLSSGINKYAVREQRIWTLTLLKVWHKLVHNFLHSAIGAARKCKVVLLANSCQMKDRAVTRPLHVENTKF